MALAERTSQGRTLYGALWVLGEALVSQERFAEAEPVARRMAEIAESQHLPNDYVARDASMLAPPLLVSGRLDEARAALDRALVLAQRSAGESQLTVDLLHRRGRGR